MNWFERWHESARRDAERQDKFIEKYYNHKTYAGIFRGLLTWAVAWYVLWHIYDILDWLHDLTGGRQSDPVKPGQIRWIRMCASAICIPPILLSTTALIVLTIARCQGWKYGSKQKQETDAQPFKSEITDHQDQ